MNESIPVWSVRIRVQQEDNILFGSGAAILLQKTKQLGSLHAAAKEMHMSYRKALEIIGRCEKHLGRLLLARSIGGTGGGGSELTDCATLLLQRFEALEQEVLAHTKRLSDGFFDNLPL